MTINEITVLYFAAASSATNLSSERIPLSTEPLRLSQLGEVLVAKHPNTNLREVLKTSQWSVEAEMVENPEDVLLKAGDEVAVICPVSGG